MDKLGFAIKLASMGAGNALECNKGAWTNKVVDIREYLKLFTGLHDTNNDVTFISFDEGGCFLTQLKALKSRGGDFLSGWIYIPNTIEISGAEVLNAYNYVRNVLTQSKIADIKSEIEDFFSKSFPKKAFPIKYQPTSGDKYGVRYIDKFYSLSEILDTNRYQSYYSSYRAIFLLQDGSEVKPSQEAIRLGLFADLTKQKIDTICTLMPPTKDMLTLAGRGVKIMFQNGGEFTTPLSCSKGYKAMLYAQREGFEDIMFKPIVVENEVQEFPLVNGLQWKKKFSGSFFRVETRDGNPIPSVRIVVNNTDITRAAALFTEEELKNAHVIISATDYVRYENTMNLLNMVDSPIRLERKEKSYDYTISLANGRDAKMTLQSKYLSDYDGYESPLKGYDLNNQYLEYSSWNIWKQRLIGFGSAIVLTCLIGGFVALDAWWYSHEFQLGWPPVKEITHKPTQYSGGNGEGMNNGGENGNSEANKGVTEVGESENDADAKVLEYMNSHSQWSKDELEKAPKTKGLYDKINSYQFTELAFMDTYGCSRLEDVKKISMSMVEGGLTMEGTYSSDGTITIQRWITKVTTKVQSGNVTESPNVQGNASQRQNEVTQKGNTINGTEDL